MCATMIINTQADSDLKLAIIRDYCPRNRRLETEIEHEEHLRNWTMALLSLAEGTP